MLRHKAPVEEKRTTWGVGLGRESIPELSLRDTHRAGLGAFFRNSRDRDNQQSNPGLQEPEQNHRVGDSQ